jgi:hypothetical protein
MHFLKKQWDGSRLLKKACFLIFHVRKPVFDRRPPVGGLQPANPSGKFLSIKANLPTEVCPRFLFAQVCAQSRCKAKASPTTEVPQIIYYKVFLFFRRLTTKLCPRSADRLKPYLQFSQAALILKSDFISGLGRSFCFFFLVLPIVNDATSNVFLMPACSLMAYLPDKKRF